MSKTAKEIAEYVLRKVADDREATIIKPAPTHKRNNDRKSFDYPLTKKFRSGRRISVFPKLWGVGVRGTF